MSDKDTSPIKEKPGLGPLKANFMNVDDVSRTLKQYHLPGVDMDSLMASQKKNMEALTAANRVALEGMQAVAKRQAEILKETMNEASKAVDSLSKAGSPPELVAKSTELTKGAVARALAHMHELAQIVAKSNEEAISTSNVRVSATSGKNNPKTIGDSTTLP